MKILDLFEVVELEIGQQHYVVITIKDSFLLSLSIEYILDPANMA